MGLSRRAARRWFGAAVLLLALVMLIIGQSLLQGRLQGLGFLLYWLCCLGLTVVAMLVALFDARRVQFRNRQEERALLQDTLDDIKAQARKKHRGPGGRGEPQQDP